MKTLLNKYIYNYMPKKHKINTYNRSRSVELFNPSAYTGYFIRRFNPPLHYTRTNVTFPLYNQSSITKTYEVGPNLSNYNLKNLSMTPWNIPNVYPLVNRRSMLV